MNTTVATNEADVTAVPEFLRRLAAAEVKPGEAVVLQTDPTEDEVLPGSSGTSPVQQSLTQ